MVFELIRHLMPRGPRVARPASRVWNSLKTIGQIIVMWTVLLGLLPPGIDRLDRWLGLPRLPALPMLGTAMFLAASVFGLVTANVLVRDGEGTPLPFDTARQLVIAGPYRYVRNPMAMFGFAQGIGIGVGLGSCAVLAYTAVGMAIWQCVARPWEEADLERRFGTPYGRYRDAVPCWIPRLTPYEATEPAISPRSHSSTFRSRS